jgi:hypothetical protein
MLPGAELYNEQIIEVAQTSSTTGAIIWEWNVWDHLVQDKDNTKDNFGTIADNPQLLDINFLGTSNGNPNWLQINSIQYNSQLDQIIISSRQTNEIFIIDHSTTILEASGHNGGIYGKGGDFLYRWGNPMAYNHGVPNDQKLFGQHYPHWIPETFVDGGKILVFNNGNGREPLAVDDYSSIEIINPTTDINNNYVYSIGTAYSPSFTDLVYDAPVQKDFYSRIMGSAQRLPNGNTLICDSDSGYFFEIDNNGVKLWEYKNPQKTNGDIISQGQTAESNLTFKAFKYRSDYSAFTGRDLTPGLPIELNSNLNVPCEVLCLEEFTAYNPKVCPNPKLSSIIINSKTRIDKIEIYHLIGSKIITIKNSNMVDLTNYKTGVYIIKIYSGNSSIIRKIIKQ